MSTETQSPSNLSERARKIIAIANQEAERLRHGIVRAEHVLLGILKEGSGVASSVLQNLGVDLSNLETEISRQLEDVDESAREETDKLVEAAELMKAAEDEAREQEHEHVGTEDVLLGMLRDGKSYAGELLTKFGVKLDEARSEVRRVLENSRRSGRPGGAPDEGQIDLSEKGRGADGAPMSLDRRLFMQFMAFRHGNREHLINRLKSEQLQAVVYQDINDANGFGVMAFCEDPTYIVDRIQPLFRESEQTGLEQKHDFTMLGRTYSIGYENDLEEVLLTRSGRRVCDPETPWAVFYPVRRSGRFERESREEQRKMLMEHGGIGHAFGRAGFATDIRLAGHGLNQDDNDFIVGLLGKELFPLSALVQRMRRTRQTSEFIESMGPFFVGKAVYQPHYESIQPIV